jgi:hypothetical protein
MNAEATADLDQLAARDDDLLPGRDGPQHDDRGGRAVIHRRCGLGATHRAQAGTDGFLAIRACPRGEVDFEIEVTAGGFVGG